MERRAREVLAQLEVSIDPRATVASLGVGERQVVEIARALAQSARLLILDEPSAALSEQEVVTLFDRIRALCRPGGASLVGGRGTVFGTVLGVLLLGTLNNGLTLLNRVLLARRGPRVLAARAVGVDQVRRRLLGAG